MKRESFWVGVIVVLLAALLLYQPLRPRRATTAVKAQTVKGEVLPELQGSWVLVAQLSAPPDQVMLFEKASNPVGQRITAFVRDSAAVYPERRRYQIVMRLASSHVELMYCRKEVDGLHRVQLLYNYDFRCESPP